MLYLLAFCLVLVALAFALVAALIGGACVVAFRILGCGGD